MRAAPQTTRARARWVSQSDLWGPSLISQEVRFRLHQPGSTTRESARVKRGDQVHTLKAEEQPGGQGTRPWQAAAVLTSDFSGPA